jgi:diguanylate cyclase (GGDEF)-like protein
MVVVRSETNNRDIPVLRDSHDREQFLCQLATAIVDLLTLNDDPTCLNQILAALGEGTGADRVYIWEKPIDPVSEKSTIRGYGEWTSAEVAAKTRKNARCLSQSADSPMRQWWSLLCQGQIIRGMAEDFPPSDRAVLETCQIRAIFLLPIPMKGEYWGCLGFEAIGDELEPSRHYPHLLPPVEQCLLKAVASSLGSAIAQRHLQAKLTHLNTQLDRQIAERTAALISANRQLSYNAYHDTLTGLPNRALLIQELEQEIERIQQNPNHPFAVLFIDLDRFKSINDSLGHTCGDRVLIETALRFMSCVRHEDLVARIGADEFAILLKGAQDLNDAKRVAARVTASLNQPFHLDGHEVVAAASIGITLGSPQYTQPEELLRDADIVMYHAKLDSQSDFAVFDSVMHDSLVEKLGLERDLRRAVSALDLKTLPVDEACEFQIHYQPIVTLTSNRITSFEALMRWHHPELGYISPGQFIPIAEETGLIVPLGEWILKRACQQLRVWQQQISNKMPIKVSVNLSGRQFAQAGLIDRIDEILQSTGVLGSSLKLEVTESAIINNADLATDMLYQLKQRKIQLCMDDFGTGYSSLSYLHRFPLDTLKIDRSFVSPITAYGQKSEIVRTIISLAHNLGMNVIAEGVETLVQRETLRSLGCEFGQGYLFSKPVDSQAASQLLG